MKKILAHIRNKPEHVKTRYVFVFAILATALVVGGWITTNRFLNKGDDTIQTEGPLKSFGKIFSGAISTAKDDYTEQRQDMRESLVNTPTINSEPVNPPTEQTDLSAE